jgi:hypothetical protein
MKKLTNILLVFMLFVTTLATAQYGIGTTSPSPSAQLELNSNTKGFLMPRMTTAERNLIPSPAAGLMVYVTDTKKPNFFNGISWIELTGVVVGGATVSGVPTNVLVTPGDTQASVSFTAPSNNGGSAITNYIVTANPGALTAQGTSSPITVTGLVNGTAYTFTVVAVNAVGNSASSAVSSSATPIGAPGAPQNPVASYTVGATQASIAFNAPASNGGATITGYTVTSNPGGLTASGTASPLVVTGLTMNQAYTFTVVANNGVNSQASIASNSITTVPNPPSAPTNVVATAGAASASVAFSAPSNNGGSPVTGYTVTSSPGNFTGTGTASPISVTGLSNGTPYTFTVVAANTGGSSVPSAASSSVTPIGAPGAPTNVVAAYVQGETQSSVSFTAPTNTGGAAITSYTVTSNPGGLTASGATSPLVVTGLTMNQAYTFTVVANNGTLNSAPSAASASITPMIVAPGAPLKIAVIPGATSNTISWEAPTTGGPVQNYIVQERSNVGHTFVGTTWTNVSTVSSTTLQITRPVQQTAPATNLIEYHYRVVASNTTGTSTSEVGSAVPVTGSTVLMHDNFNSQPSTPKWEFVNNALFQNAAASNLDPLHISKMYGQADGRWKIERTSTGGGITASTVYTIDRSSTTKEIQFDYNPVGGSFVSQSHSIGLVDPSGRIFRLFLNNPSNNAGTAFTSFTGSDWNTALGASAATPSGQNQTGAAVSPAGNSHVHYRIILPAAGGMEIRASNGFNNTVTTYTAAQVPAAWNNLKFFVWSTHNSYGTNWHTIDNFTILGF